MAWRFTKVSAMVDFHTDGHAKKGETDSAQSYASFTARLERGVVLAVSGDAIRRPEPSQAHLVSQTSDAPKLVRVLVCYRTAS